MVAAARQDLSQRSQTTGVRVQKKLVRQMPPYGARQLHQAARSSQVGGICAGFGLWIDGSPPARAVGHVLPAGRRLTRLGCEPSSIRDVPGCSTSHATVRRTAAA